MHYKNGREAKLGDSVIYRTYQGGKTVPTAGVIHSLNPGASSCNGVITCVAFGGVSSTSVNVGEGYHAEDAFNALDGAIAVAAPAPTA